MLWIRTCSRIPRRFHRNFTVMAKYIDLTVKPLQASDKHAAKKADIALRVKDEDTVASVLARLRSEHDVPQDQSLVLQFRELDPSRTLKSYLIGSEARGSEVELKIFKSRNRLLEIESKIQQQWEDNKTFEQDAPEDASQPKFMLTFPYPYMNGILHVGHAFSLSKAEFTAGYQRMLGKRVLFPFGFHCTGMPIVACAQKLEREIKQFGNPPTFPVTEPPKAEEKKDDGAPAADKKKVKKKGKAAKKKSTKLYQWEIMREMGVPEERIHEFADPDIWLDYFSPKGMSHLKKFGLKADFRRSFITTSRNPYYDRFIRWQFNLLKKRDFVYYGKRPTIFSPLDNMPCGDHDRASGEGIKEQEYTLVKLKVVPGETPFTKAKVDQLAEFAEKCNIYLVAGTLRPETMYGQTNCYVKPDGDYSLCKMNETDIFVCSKQSNRNMAYQSMTEKFGEVNILKTIKGWDLLGRKLKAPNAVHEFVYTLPMTTIDMEKATGVVTSVPSDSPDDFTALRDLQNDKKMRDKYYISDEMVNIDVVPIIRIPDHRWGNLAAVNAVEEAKIKNQKDPKLADAKKEVYKLGFHKGIMDIGPFKGMPVQKAKDEIRKQLIKDGLAHKYYEPSEKVVSRSGETCVVTEADQWYLKYGEAPWQQIVSDHVKNTMDMYTQSTEEKFEEAVDWLGEWACSRTFGLGTKMPFDESWVIESLSDSTIYMAYYTIAHILQKGVLDGRTADKSSPDYIAPEDLTDEFFNAIFLGGEVPAGCKIPQATVDKMQKEFNYWYPLDLRVSGKDLIGNHLTMALYNHAVIWQDDKSKWPRSMFTNGHATINGEKMSKSTGNFMTLIEAISQFSADATRFALCDAGDGNEDANFSGETCNAAVLRLAKEETWLKANIQARDSMRTGAADSFADRVFANHINRAIHEAKHAYDRMRYKEALRYSVYELGNHKNQYVARCGDAGIHRDLFDRFAEVYLLLSTPITPHWCEYVWSEILGKSGSIIDARFPEGPVEDQTLTRKASYLEENAHNLRVAHRDATQVKKKKGKKAKANEQPAAPPNAVYLFVAREYPEVSQAVIGEISRVYDSDESRGMEAKEKFSLIKKFIGARPELQGLPAKQRKRPEGELMKFASYILKQYESRGTDALALRMPFDERELVNANSEWFLHELPIKNLTVVCSDDVDIPLGDIGVDKLKKAVPGEPQFHFYHSESI